MTALSPAPGVGLNQIKPPQITLRKSSRTRTAQAAPTAPPEGINIEFSGIVRINTHHTGPHVGEGTPPGDKLVSQDQIDEQRWKRQGQDAQSRTRCHISFSVEKKDEFLGLKTHKHGAGHSYEPQADSKYCVASDFDRERHSLGNRTAITAAGNRRAASTSRKTTVYSPTTLVSRNHSRKRNSRRK